MNKGPFCFEWKKKENIINERKGREREREKVKNAMHQMLIICFNERGLKEGNEWNKK